jgi:Na+-driven multidrug efflux pump
MRVPLAALAAHIGAGLSWVWAALIADHFSRMMINGFAFVFGGWERRTGERIGRRSARGESTLPP